MSTPTLRRVSIGGPGEQVPLGEDDYVLDSYYDPQRDAWTVLVLVQPTDPEDDETEEAEA